MSTENTNPDTDNSASQFNPVTTFEDKLRNLDSFPDVDKELLALLEAVRFLRHLSPELANGTLLDPIMRLFERRYREVHGEGNSSDLSSKALMLLTVAAVNLLQTDMGADEKMGIDAARTRILDEACPKGVGILRPTKVTSSSNSNEQGVVDRAALKRWESSSLKDDRAIGVRVMEDQISKKCSNHSEVVEYVKHAWNRTLPIREAAQREADDKVNSQVSKGI